MMVPFLLFDVIWGDINYKVRKIIKGEAAGSEPSSNKKDLKINDLQAF